MNAALEKELFRREVIDDQPRANTGNESCGGERVDFREGRME